MSFELLIFLFIALGLLSGLLGGLLGIGGGVVTVPPLYFIFQYSGVFEGKIMQVAVATALAAGFVTSAASTFAQLRKKAVLFPVVKFLVPGLGIGCVAGSAIAHYLSSSLLSWIFGAVAILLGIYFCIPKLPHLSISSSPNRSLSLFGFCIGTLSSLLGIGGGSLTFPVLLGYHVPVKNASATSSASTLLTTFIGSIAYLAIAWNQPELPQTFGYIDLPAFTGIGIGSILSSHWGVKLSHTLNVILIKQIFGCSLALIGLSMFFL